VRQCRDAKALVHWYDETRRWATASARSLALDLYHYRERAKRSPTAALDEPPIPSRSQCERPARGRPTWGFSGYLGISYLPRAPAAAPAPLTGPRSSSHRSRI
jgi:hypothetical protein